jgi:hypothetical protein
MWFEGTSIESSHPIVSFPPARSQSWISARHPSTHLQHCGLRAHTLSYTRDHASFPYQAEYISSRTTIKVKCYAQAGSRRQAPSAPIDINNFCRALAPTRIDFSAPLQYHHVLSGCLDLASLQHAYPPWPALSLATAK